MPRAGQRFFIATITALVLFSGPSLSASQSKDPYEGQTVRIIVGYSPGGGFDTFARLLARHFGRNIPGQPSVIVQNMPGAGSMMAANWVYAKQPGDGRTIVTFHAALITQSLIDPSAKFDPLKYIWLGEPSLGGLPQVLWVRSDLPIRSLDDLMKRKDPIVLGATGVGTSPALVSEILSRAGVPVKSVHGYKGSADVMAALERKELDGRITSQDTMETIYRRFVDEKLVHPILSFGSDPRVKPVTGVATLKDLKLTADQRRLADFLVDSFSMLRVFAMPPGTPPGRVEVLRGAFMRTLKDPQLIHDAERQGVNVSPLSGEEVEQTVKKLAQTPREILEEYKKLIGKK